MAGRITPERVTRLTMCEIFVFGSNLDGLHYGGAARMAHERFGAEWGVGAGPTGRCYAIPTMHGGVELIKPYVDDFIEYARSHPNNRFLLTRVGCGIAGFTDEEMAPLFREALDLYNVTIPKEWMWILTQDEFTDAVMFGICPPKKTVELPEAITEADLARFCEEFKYIIGARIVAAPKPEITVRYITDDDKFGYSGFGDFFYDDSGELYVWTRKEEYAGLHNQDLVEAIFGDECEHRGYFIPVIYAGIRTPYRDCKGEDVYTGDVLEIETGEGERHTLALCSMGWNEDGYKARYAFPLDNHFLPLVPFRRLRRVGTVFYELERGALPVPINWLCGRFQPAYPDGTTEDERIALARHTPSFI